MASTKRQLDVGLKALLEREGNRFSFFPAIRLLHRLNPNAKAVGRLGPPEREAVRFSHDPALVFYSSDISAITFSGELTAEHAKVVCTFLGLYGSDSPLATHFSEDVLQAELHDENSLRAFYDLFHHRLLSLFYRSWTKYRPHVTFRDDATDATTQRFLACVGNDPRHVDPTPALSPFLKLALAPLFAMRTRPEKTLRLVLQRALPGVQVQVIPFIERRAVIPKLERVSLGVHNTTLGVDMTIGQRVRDRSGRIRVVVGPVTYQYYEDYMPGGRHYAQLSRMLGHLTGDFVETELEVQLASSESPGLQLGNRQSSILGLNTQIGFQKQSGRRTRVLLGADVDKARPYAVAD